MVNALRKYGIFLVIPAIVLGFSVFLKIAAGPYWLAPNFDPAYQYLINGLYLLKGIVPNHTDHPGTPLQMLCCAVYWLYNMGRPAGDIVTNVLMFPEFYLRTVFAALSLFAFFTSFVLAVYVFRKTNDPLAAGLAQLPALSFLFMKSWETFEPVLPVVANVDPEPLLISVVNLFNICLLMSFFSKTSKDGAISTLLWGIFCGLGVAVKLTFLPLVAVPLIVLSWKDKISFICAFAASFIIWTLPILSKYPIIWGWISGIAMHKGTHGYLFAGLLLAALAFVFWQFIGKNWEKEKSFFAASMVGICLQFFAVTKHPGAHYLLPGIGLLSAFLVLFYFKIAANHILGRRIAFVCILMGVIGGSFQANAYRLKLENFTKDIHLFYEQVRTKYQNCTFIDYYRSSGKEAALFFGDGWNLSPHLGAELYQLYPAEFNLNIWGNSISSFNGRVWSNDLLAQNSCVLFQGDGGVDFKDGPYDLRLLEKGRFESIHLLTGSTEKQAAIFLAGAMQYIQAGNYPKALACALQARKFHYQPDGSVESLIQLVKPYLQNQ